jgi:hypothetical protein
VVRAYQDAALWQSLRMSALSRIEEEACPDRYGKKVDDILTSDGLTQAPTPE